MRADLAPFALFLSQFGQQAGCVGRQGVDSLDFQHAVGRHGGAGGALLMRRLQDPPPLNECYTDVQSLHQSATVGGSVSRLFWEPCKDMSIETGRVV